MTTRAKFLLVLEAIKEKSTVEALAKREGIDVEALMALKDDFLVNGHKLFHDEFSLEDRFNILMDSIPATVSHISSSLIYLNVNKKLCDILGLPKSELLGRPVGFIDGNREFHDFVQSIFDSGDDGLTKESIVTIRSKPYQYLLAGKKFENGKELVVIGIDISMMKKQEDILIFRSRLAAMGEMIGNITHQWRQPLSSISLSLRNIEVSMMLGNLTDEKLKENIGAISDTVNFMSQTITDFKDFFKPNQTKSTFSIAKKVNDSLSIMQGSLRENRIEVINLIEPGASWEVFGMESEYMQVILNILQNALDALVEKRQEARKITISLRSGTGQQRPILQIEDNAGGIALEILENIFDPYVTTKGEDGSGIGLYISKNIITKHMDGSLSVHNGKEGAVFSICI